MKASMTRKPILSQANRSNPWPGMFQAPKKPCQRELSQAHIKPPITPCCAPPSTSLGSQNHPWRKGARQDPLAKILRPHAHLITCTPDLAGWDPELNQPSPGPPRGKMKGETRPQASPARLRGCGSIPSFDPLLHLLRGGGPNPYQRHHQSAHPTSTL